MIIIFFYQQFKILLFAIPLTFFFSISQSPFAGSVDINESLALIFTLGLPRRWRRLWLTSSRSKIASCRRLCGLISLSRKNSTAITGIILLHLVRCFKGRGRESLMYSRKNKFWRTKMRLLFIVLLLWLLWYLWLSLSSRWSWSFLLRLYGCTWIIIYLYFS